MIIIIIIVAIIILLYWLNDISIRTITAFSIITIINTFTIINTIIENIVTITTATFPIIKM